LRIGYFGDGLWAHNALDSIVETPGLEVAFVVARFDNPDPVLQEKTQNFGLPWLELSNVNADQSLEQMAALHPDINVSMSFNQIFRQSFLDITPQGAINCHAGALPFYRGRNVLNWALINGDKSFGITVHHVDEGIDTGDIIIQEHVAIADDDDYGAVLATAHSRCANVLHTALVQIVDGSATRTPQSAIHPVGFYCAGRRPGDEAIDWAAASEQVHNFVRALALPSPGARTMLNGTEVAILRTKLIPQAPTYIGVPGDIVGRSHTGITVKTGTSSVLVTEIADVDDAGAVTGQRQANIAIGHRFASL